MDRIIRKPKVRTAGRIVNPVELRSDIGVISPFSLAEAILGMKIDWSVKNRESGMHLLEEAFEVDYASLFSPVNESPLYRNLPALARVSAARPRAEVVIQKEKASVTRPVTQIKPFVKASPGWRNPLRMLGAILRPGPKQKAMRAEVASSPLQRVATGAAPPCTANVVWQPCTGGACPPPPPPGSDGDYGLLFGTHPIQGCAPDCYFIAALSSLAWTDPASLMGAAGDPDRFDYFFTAVDSSLNPEGDIIENYIDNVLPYNSGTKDLAFARSRVRDSVWPALYEKAFAVFKGMQPPATPDIPGMGFGNPVSALCSIMLYNGSARLTTGLDGHGIFKEINGLCGNTGIGGKTQFPMVAWTYRDTPSVDSLSYETDLLAANHSYSILGTMVAEDLECIVLRNPFVYSVAPPIAGVHDGSWKFTDWYSLGGTYQPGGGQQRSMKLQTTDGSEGDGTFALEADAFVKYFEGYGWIGI